MARKFFPRLTPKPSCVATIKILPDWMAPRLVASRANNSGELGARRKALGVRDLVAVSYFPLPVFRVMSVVSEP